jgi:hypothetical protein
MHIPDEFNQFCRHFHQDVMILQERPDDAVDMALKSMSADQQNTLRIFLGKVFDAASSLQEAKRAWRRSPAEVGFNNKVLLALLRSAHSKVGSGSNT